MEHNLYGLDIDDRAYQLSYFAVLMKARQYDRMILKKHIQSHVYSIQESNSINRNQLKYFGADMSVIEQNNAMNQLTGLLDTFKDAKEYGSILNVDRCDWELLRRFAENDRVVGQMDFEAFGIDQTKKQLITLIEIGETMAQKYHVVTTNPPYLSEMNKSLQAFVKKYYPLSKNDLCTVFIDKCRSMSKIFGYVGMITQNGFMFLSRYEKMRRELLSTNFVNMAHLGSRAFDAIGGEVVQTAAFILRNARISNYLCCYSRLVDFSSERGKEEAYLQKGNIFLCPNERFDKIPRAPMTYWVSDKTLDIFKESRLDEHADPKVGMFTTDNDKYLREWWEPKYIDIGFAFPDKESAYASDYKWFPYNKGGGFRRWYGILDLVVYWYHGGEEIRRVVLEKYPYLNGNYDFVLKTSNPYCKPGITWSGLTSGSNSFRLCGDGFFFDTNKGAMLFEKDIDLYYLLALLNSKSAQYAIDLLNSTISLQISDVASIPVIYDKKMADVIESISKQNVEICKNDWDSSEISWDFKKAPLVEYSKVCCSKNTLIKAVFSEWERHTRTVFDELKRNERELNRIFIDMYALNEELDADPADSEISVNLADLKRDIKALISYAVGCMFGRYSLDIEGLAYAGGDWKEAYETKYKTFMPDADAIIPITDEEYFKDDIVARFVDFIRIVYGEETLEKNLKFIADALGNKGDTPRAVIRNYFLNDFYKDHCNTYSVTGSGKRPIYWLFDSGKQNGFKALIYIHRYTPDTVGLIRSVYLHNAQAAIQNSLQNSEYIISTTTSATERARETRKKDKYVKQLNELRPYYQALSHIALQRIQMDLDDGVKKNYQLFQGVEVSTEGKKKQTIDLLAKI